MINNTTLVGRLTKPVEVRYTGSGIAVTNFTLAVERNYKQNGETKSDFINCIMWRERAENLANMTAKGSLIGITGSIETGSYQNNEGNTVYTTEVNADNFYLLEPKSVTDQRRSGGQAQQQNNYNSQSNQGQQQNNNPFANVDLNSNDPFETNNDTDIDDDLPF